MKWIIDMGNSRVKSALFELDKIVDFNSFDYTDPLLISHLHNQIQNHPIRQIGILNVSEKNIDIEAICPNTPVFHLNFKAKIPFYHTHKTPQTLGADRIALVAGAFFAFPRKNVFIASYGTCVTYDFIDENGLWHGGNIAPGLSMRAQAMHDYTAALPKVDVKLISSDLLWGETTQSSINQGVVLGAQFELEGYINLLSQKYPKLISVISGGDMKLIEGLTKSCTFANPFLLLHGLNKLTDYNTL